MQFGDLEILSGVDLCANAGEVLAQQGGIDDSEGLVVGVPAPGPLAPDLERVERGGGRGNEIPSRSRLDPGKPLLPGGELREPSEPEPERDPRCDAVRSSHLA